MSEVLKSEFLRSISGFAMLGVASFVILIPGLALSVGPPLDGLRALDDGMATRMVFGLIASVGIVAMYLGSYAVSREFYYHSMPRTVVISSLRKVFAAKLISSAVTSAGLCLVGVVIWAGVTAVVLATNGRQALIDGAWWTIVGGSLLAAVCGGVIGAAAGWIVRNYYAVSGLVLMVPLMIELPLLFSAPEVERFLPVGAFAGVTGAPIDGLLPWWGSAIVLFAWTVGSAALAAVVVRRRDA